MRIKFIVGLFLVLAFVFAGCKANVHRIEKSPKSAALKPADKAYDSWLTVEEAIAIYYREFAFWFLGEKDAESDDVRFVFVDLDLDGVKELVRLDTEGTGHYTTPTIFYIKSDLTLAKTRLKRKEDFSCFFDFLEAQALEDEEGKVAWYVSALTTSNALGAQVYHRYGLIRPLEEGEGFEGEELFSEFFDNEPEEGEECEKFFVVVEGESEELSKERYLEAKKTFFSAYTLRDAKVVEIDIPHPPKARLTRQATKRDLEALKCAYTSAH